MRLIGLSRSFPGKRSCAPWLWTHHGAQVLAQIGVEIHSCPGRCHFCAFAAEQTIFGRSVMCDEDIPRGETHFHDLRLRVCAAAYAHD